jgi:hypothetical protein
MKGFLYEKIPAMHTATLSFAVTNVNFKGLVEEVALKSLKEVSNAFK